MSQLVGFLLLLVVLFTVAQLVVWGVGHVLGNRFNKKITSHNGREIISSLFVGLLVACMIDFLHSNPALPIEEIEDASMDLVMGIEGFRQKYEEVPHIVILDIDEKIHKNWGYPLITPRNHLKTLIETAVEAKAQLVVVDIDLSRDTPFSELKKLTKEEQTSGEKERDLEKAANQFELHPFDQVLYNYILNYKEKCKNEQSGCVPIVLFGHPPERIENKGIGQISKAGFLGPAVEKSDPYVQWVTAEFLTKLYQPVVRRVSLWEPVCSKETQKVEDIIPSMTLLVATWYRNGILQQPEKFQQFQDNIFTPSKDKFLSQLNDLKCEDSQYVPNTTFNIGKLEGHMTERIYYSIPWNNKESNKTKVPDKCTNDCILEVQRAGDFIFTSDKSKLDENSSLKDKVVIIGGSYLYNRAGDIHLTPLGEMPGVLILSNAIYSQLQGEENSWEKLLEDKLGLHIPESLLKCVIEGILIIIMSLMMMHKKFFYGMVGCCYVLIFVLFKAEIVAMSPLMMIGVVIISAVIGFVIYLVTQKRFYEIVLSAAIITFLLLGANAYLVSWFERSTWFGFAIPLIAVMFHQVVDAVDLKRDCVKIGVRQYEILTLLRRIGILQ